MGWERINLLPTNLFNLFLRPRIIFANNKDNSIQHFKQNKNVEDIVVFLTPKVFDSDNFFITIMQKCANHFYRESSNKKKQHRKRNKNIDILKFIFDQTKLLRVLLWIRHRPIWMQGPLKLHLQSFKTINIAKTQDDKRIMRGKINVL